MVFYAALDGGAMMKKPKKTILVVDDMSDALRLIKAVLEESYSVRLAKSADLADSILRNVDVDLVILDVEMPGVSGIEYARRLKGSPLTWHIPIIFLSVHSQAEIVASAGQIDIKGYIKKPATPELLIERVEAALSRG